MDKDDGGPAFPRVQHEGWKEAHFGMSLRDYFAAKAMQFLVSTVSKAEDAPIAARDAYIMADAMLKARQQQD